MVIKQLGTLWAMSENEREITKSEDKLIFSGYNIHNDETSNWKKPQGDYKKQEIFK